MEDLAAVLLERLDVDELVRCVRFEVGTNESIDGRALS